MNNFKKINLCRVCNSSKLTKIIDLKKKPLANDFSSKKTIKFPLAVKHCLNCFHNQLSIGINPNILFKKYFYQSSFSKSYNDHSDYLVKKLKSRFKLTKKSIIFDIGSNDGILLKSFKKINLLACGIEPSKNLAKIANKKGLLTKNLFFNSLVSKKLLKDYGKADLVTANNVFAHILNFNDFIKGLNIILADNGVFVVEVSYFKDVILKNLFDTIYHEHIDYHLLLPLQKLFNLNNLNLFHAESISTHGGSIRIFVTKQKIRKTKKLQFLIKKEKIFIKKFNYNIKKFNFKINHNRKIIIKIIKNFKKDKKQIICYGASAKATIFINTYNLSKYLDKCLDDSKTKHGKMIPGTKIKIINPKNYTFRKTDLILVTAWNFTQDIVKKIRKKNRNIKILSPLPTIKLYQ